jgi:hypothetical protein
MTQTQYILEGNLVTKRTYSEEYVVPLSEMLPELTAYTPLEMSPLPDNLKYVNIQPADDMGIDATFIVQEPPRIQQIRYKNALIYTDAEHKPFNLPVPFTSFWVNMTGTKNRGPRGEQMLWSAKSWGFLWSRGPFKDMNTPMTYGWMPNCYKDSRVCFGTNNIDATAPAGEYVNGLVNMFWTSGFNTDLNYPWPYPTMDEWQKEGEKNPGCWTDWKAVWKTERPVKEITGRISKANWSDPIPSVMDGKVIPQIAILPTFQNVQDWKSNLTKDQLARVKAALK